ncbi:unnamed protein product [Citrullus colocynthis]|uniref:Uncharacterized protein n=1 Tax=Citrullus colocynthis TaxID=252529 RepID=A0ABP0Z7Y3_9ROSI
MNRILMCYDQTLFQSLTGDEGCGEMMRYAVLIQTQYLWSWKRHRSFVMSDTRCLFFRSLDILILGTFCFKSPDLHHPRHYSPFFHSQVPVAPHKLLLQHPSDPSFSISTATAEAAARVILLGLSCHHFHGGR